MPRKLRRRSPHGADGQCREGILLALLAAQLENINTFTGLTASIGFRPSQFRYQYGLRLDREAPSIATLSRVFAELTSKGLAKRLSSNASKKESSMGVMLQSIVQRFMPTRKKTKRTKLTCNANWSAKIDSFGNKAKWFGYKLYLAVELPASCKWRSR